MLAGTGWGGEPTGVTYKLLSMLFEAVSDPCANLMGVMPAALVLRQNSQRWSSPRVERPASPRQDVEAPAPCLSSPPSSRPHSRAGCSTCYHPPSRRRPVRMPTLRDHRPTRRRKSPRTKPTAPGPYPPPTRASLPSSLLSLPPGDFVAVEMERSGLQDSEGRFRAQRIVNIPSSASIPAPPSELPGPR